MQSLVIYDNEGKVVFTNTNHNISEGDFSAIITTIPNGKMLVGVNVETSEPIFKDIPKSELELLREENDQLKNSLADLWEVVLLGGAE